MRVHLFCHINLPFENYNMLDKHLCENKENLQVNAIVKLGCNPTMMAFKANFKSVV